MSYHNKGCLKNEKLINEAWLLKLIFKDQFKKIKQAMDPSKKIFHRSIIGDYLNFLAIYHQFENIQSKF